MNLLQSSEHRHPPTPIRRIFWCLLYIAVVLTLAILATAIQPGGPF